MFLKTDASQLFSPGPRMGRMAESMPVLPANAGWKQEVLIAAYKVRSPLDRLGLQLRIGRGDQPSLPVIRRFKLEPLTPCTEYPPIADAWLPAVLPTAIGAPDMKLVMPVTCQSSSRILVTGLFRAETFFDTAGRL